jgi:predicted cobalt transporter CbtA
MLRDYLRRGVKAGLVAGLVFGLFMAFVANPLVAYADGQNHAADGEHGHAGEHDHGPGDGHAGEAGHHDAAVSPAIDEAVSVLSGGLWAVLLGGVVFGVGFYLLEPLVPGTGATRSYLLGLAGFVTVSGAPWLVVPPVAPGAEQSLPTDARLSLYAGMIVAGAVVCLLSAVVYDRLRDANGRAVAAVVALLPFALLAVPTVLAPTNAVEGALSPALRSGLTGLFVFGQALVWLVLAGAHAQFGPTDGTPAGRSTVDTDPAVVAD